MTEIVTSLIAIICGSLTSLFIWLTRRNYLRRIRQLEAELQQRQDEAEHWQLCFRNYDEWQQRAMANAFRTYKENFHHDHETTRPEPPRWLVG